MKDMLGQDLALGDIVAYPTHDFSMKGQMVVGKLVGFTLGKTTTGYYDQTTRRFIRERVEVPKMKIQSIARSRVRKFDPETSKATYGTELGFNNKTTTITNIDNVLKVKVNV